MKKIVLKKKGKKTITMNKGGLHRSLGVPEGQKIPAKLMAEAKAGKHGPKAKKQANAATGLLKKGRQTAMKNRRKKRAKSKG